MEHQETNHPSEEQSSSKQNLEQIMIPYGKAQVAMHIPPDIHFEVLSPTTSRSFQ